MKLFSSVGAFNIMALNPWIHFGIGMVLSISMVDREQEKLDSVVADDEVTLTCLSELDLMQDRLRTVHFIVCGLLILHWLWSIIIWLLMTK